MDISHENGVNNDDDNDDDERKKSAHKKGNEQSIATQRLSTSTQEKQELSEHEGRRKKVMEGVLVGRIT